MGLLRTIGRVAGGVLGLGGGLFRSKQIQPPPSRIEDILLPEGQELRRRLITDVGGRLVGGEPESEEERLAREELRDILRRSEDGGASREFQDYLRLQDAIDRLENERLAEAERQQAIADYIPAGPARGEAIDRRVRELEARRRAERSGIALDIGRETRARRERGISLASDLATERRRRNLADVAGTIDILGTARGYPVTSPGFAPSPFSQIATGAGQVAGAVSVLRRGRRKRTPSTFPETEEAPSYPEQFRAKYPDLSGAFKRTRTRPFQIF